MTNPIKVGSRKSALALAQVKEVFDSLKTVPLFEVTTFDAAGDIDKTTSLTSKPAENFFTDVLDQALLRHEIDVAIHSAKDLPAVIPNGLKIFALTAVLDDTDAWVGKIPWANLAEGVRVGTSSALRQRQTIQLHPKATIVDIRGTIEERIDLFKQGKS